MRAAGRLSAVFILLAAPGAAQVPADTAAPEVEAVVFEGVRALDKRLLRAAITTRETECESPLYALACAAGDWDWAERKAFLDTAAVRADADSLRRTYALWGYPDAAARAEVDTLGDGDVRVRFHVTEGEPVRVRAVVVRGADAMPDAGVELPIAPGDVYALPRIQAAQRQVARRFGEQGYAFVQVEVPPQPISGGTADVVLEVRPGPVSVFGPTVVRAEAPLRSDDLRRRLPYRPGQRFTPALLEHAAERLYALPIVDSVGIRPGGVTWSDSVVETAIVVGAAPPNAYQIEGVLSSGSCVGAEGFVSNRHAFGAPRVVTVSAGASNLLASEVCGRDEEGRFREPAYYVRASVAQPVGRSSWLLLDAGFARETAPGAYVRRGWQARAGYAREVARGLTGTLAFAPERSDNEAGGLFFCALYGACGGAGEDDGPGSSLITPVEARLDWERAGARAALGPPPAGPAWMRGERPRWVSSASLAVLAAGGATGSDHDFARALLEGSLTHLLGARVQVGARARLGALAGADQPLPPQLRLFGGGPRGVRGVPANRLGPRILELRDAEDATCGDISACLPPTPDEVFVRAAGGDLLLETSVEARWWLTRGLQLAAFVDYGAVRSRGGAAGPLAGTRTESLLTPGLGVLAITPVGPLRVDVAYDPSGPRSSPLLVRDEATGAYTLLREVRYDPFGYDDPDPWTELGRRLQIQISTGTPF